VSRRSHPWAGTTGFVKASWMPAAEERCRMLGRQASLLQANLCCGTAGRMGPHDHLWKSGEGTRPRARGCARCRSSHGQESGGANHPLPQGLGSRR
jgi:hypothetical protein